MYLSKNIRALIKKATGEGAAKKINGVQFINATGGVLVLDDGTEIGGCSAIAVELEKMALGRLTEFFMSYKEFGCLDIGGHVFDIGSQSFMEYRRKNKPLIVVAGDGVAQLLGKPTIVATPSTKEGIVSENTWRLYWELGDPYRIR